ncbi:MAG: nucleotidyltransferase family protein [Fimbriimonadaceae bacterium]|nr:nucleotidyltransferase family protein [Fimbriimonadaceae bacterium]
MDKLDVIIPAGGKLDDNFARVVGTHSKALIKFEKRTILESTIQALRESDRIDRIIVVGSSEVIESSAVAEATDVLPEGGSGPENIFRGLDALMETSKQPERVIITTCDLPFMTGKTVSNFLDLCPDGIDFCVPLISKVDFEESFPRAEATFVELRDGIYTTGCMYNVDTRALRKALHQIDTIFKRRKSKLGMARVLGFTFAWKLMNKHLVVSDIEKKVFDMLGCNGRAIHDSPPELAYDVDYIEDYHYALQTFQSLRSAVPTS